MSESGKSVSVKKGAATLGIGGAAYDIVVYAMLLLIVVVCFYPFWYIFILSINNALDSMKGGVYLWPRVITLESYRAVLGNSDMLHAAWISIARTAVGSVFSLFFTTLLAYGISKKDVPGCKAISIFFIFTMYFGGGLIPYYMVLKAVGLIDSFWVYIIPGAISVYNMILVRIYIETLPTEMEESAKLDGANDIVILFRIILPLCTPVLATVTLLFAVSQWNSWFDTNLFVYSRDLVTLQFLLVQILGQFVQGNTQAQAAILAQAANRRAVSPDSIRMATTMIATVPIILVYPFLQKYFTKGIMLGAVKS